MSTEGSETSHPLPLWQKATPADVDLCEIDAPIAGLNFVESYALETAYQKALSAETGEDDLASARRRVYSMLCAVTSMYRKEGNTREPYGAKMVLADGRRTALVEDFRGPAQDALARAAARTANTVLCARLSDVVWLLDRRLADAARAALTAYVDIVDCLVSGELRSELSAEDGYHFTELSDVLDRALAIARTTGWEKPEALRARGKTSELRAAALKARQWGAIRSYVNLDLRYGVSEPAEVGASLEAALNDGAAEHDNHEFWKLAARAFGNADDADAKHRCLRESAESLVRQAGKFQGSAMMCAHWLSSAIAQLHGLPGVKDRRKELSHRLVDVQAGIPDEMSSFSNPIDISSIVHQVEEAVGGLNLRDALFFFADMERSPDPIVLKQEAEEAIRQFPLSSLFGATHHDRKGAVVHRIEGGDYGDGNGGAIRQKISQNESIRRQLLAQSQIDTVRRNLTERHYLSRETFRALLRHSPFVPADQLDTYCRGFSRFFEGDFVSAIYILTPLLENSLRHVLRQCGLDVSKFDDATQTQEERTISSLFEQMRPQINKIFGDRITTDIDNVFLAKPGPGIRHAVAHGLLSDGDPYGPDALYACWLIFRLCCLPLFDIRESIEILK